MSNANIELAEWVNSKTVEKAWARALHAQKVNDVNFLRVGMRAARARDPKLLLALEKGSEVMDKLAEAQQGRTRRSSEVEGLKVEFTETQMWKRAYELCDAGNPIENLAYVYGAASVLAGFIL